MYIDLSELSPNQVYYSMIQTLVPRPVAWVLSDNGTRSASGAASYNLAPFSYFTGISSKPPTIMISVGKKPDGSFKDTRVNIEARGQFVVHIAHRELAPSVTESSRTLAHGESELDRLDLDLADFADFRLPRIAGCRVAMACERHAIQEFGEVPQSLIFGLVKTIYVDDSVVTVDEKGRASVHADKLDPVARLGGNDYTTFGEIITVPRPK